MDLQRISGDDADLGELKVQISFSSQFSQREGKGAEPLGDAVTVNVGVGFAEPFEEALFRVSLAPVIEDLIDGYSEVDGVVRDEEDVAVIQRMSAGFKDLARALDRAVGSLDAEQQTSNMMSLIEKACFEAFKQGQAQQAYTLDSKFRMELEAASMALIEPPAPDPSNSSDGPRP